MVPQRFRMQKDSMARLYQQDLGLRAPRVTASPVDLWIRAGPILRPEAYSLPERKMVTIRIMVRITASVKPRKPIRDAPR